MNVPPLVAVVGDSLLDRDIDGRATRLAPDAPVPVLDDLGESDRPGGAALAAALTARSGVRTVLITATGRDAAGERLRALLDAHGVQVLDAGLRGATPEKIRVCSGGRPLLRMDRGGGGDHEPIAACALTALQAADAVLVSDYGRGLASDPAIVRALAQATDSTPVAWDPHPRGRTAVAGCAVVTPNRSEVAAFLGVAPAADSSAAGTQAAELRAQWSAHAVLVTLGDGGAVLVDERDLPLTIPTAHAAGDCCGAGDALAAGAVSALARGLPVQRAAALAVDAATAYVAGGGPAAVIPGNTATDPGDSAAGLAAQVRARGGRVIATGGCFDLVHAGHLALLEAARRLGDCLIVCVNSDESVRRLKGARRPLVGEDDRVAVLRAVRWVDSVELFSETTPDAALRRLRPHVWVKGGDYSGEDLPERDVLAEWGGEISIVPYLSGRSTTQLLALARRSA